MDDLISRQAMLDGIDKLIKIHFDRTVVLYKARKVAEDLPSAQPDIIRCKDCAYCDSDVVDAPYGMTRKIFWCDRLYAGANENLIVEPDNFCSWVERREDATD